MKQARHQMSRIYLTSHAGTAEIAGAERYHLLTEVNNLAYNTPTGRSAGPLPGVPQLNAVLGMGTDLAILVARLAGQIELLLWVDGPNRTWLANIIERGTRTGVLRVESGWPAAVQLLLSTDTEPVFIYSTQGEPFPNAEQWAGDEEGWQALAEADKWAHCEGVLRAETEREDATAYLAEHPVLFAAPFSRELRPSNWHQFFFAEPVTA
jgi:hypothetical protein